MQLLKQKIEVYNRKVHEKLYHLKFSDPVSKLQIKQIKDFYKIQMPIDLVTFYNELGSINSDEKEGLCLQIESVINLFKHLKSENEWSKLYSFGLIDYIKFSWGNDRYEFEELEQKDIEYLNENFKCIGLYRYDNGLEEAFYIYFDKNQKFGLVRYHQDDFDELWNEHLEKMLIKSPANQNLEELIISIVDKLEIKVLEEQ